MMLSFTTRRHLCWISPDQPVALLCQRGFSLLEVAIVLVIVTILFTAVGVPLASQLQARRTEETRKLLEEVKDALLGFSVANARLPCPATASSGGQESFCPSPTGACAAGTEITVVQNHGNCSHFYNGFLPASTLGLSGLDDQGFLRDAWGEQANRIRYAVYSPNRDLPPTTVGSENHPFTKLGGMQSATISVLGDVTVSPNPYLYICASGTGVTASSCGSAANTLTTRAPILIFSLGPNASASTAGTDETENLPASNNKVFVSHTPTIGGTNEFDDIATWISINTIIKKMLDAGKLP